MRKIYKSFALFAVILISQQGWSQVALSLSGALGRAMDNNYGLIISRADTEIAYINNNPGNAGRYPTIGFDASDNNSYDLKSETYASRFSAGIGLNWVLFDGFRVNITKSKLENLESLSEGRLGVVIESTIEDVILGYYSVLLQMEQLEVLQTVMELSNDCYQYELNRKSLGGSVTYDVLQAQNVYLTDKANYMTQEVVVRNSVRNLNFLLGESPTTTWDFTEAFEADTSEYALADLFHLGNFDLGYFLVNAGYLYGSSSYSGGVNIIGKPQVRIGTETSGIYCGLINCGRPRATIIRPGSKGDCGGVVSPSQ